jgi:hypothetical protein
MAFINCTDKLTDFFSSKTNIVELWRNDAFHEGAMANRQLLRKLINGQWELDLRVNFISFRIPLQEQQARIIIDGSYTKSSGFDCVIVGEV